MKILITGGAGYIGNTIASACLDAGHEVVLLGRVSKVVSDEGVAAGVSVLTVGGLPG